MPAANATSSHPLESAASRIRKPTSSHTPRTISAMVAIQPTSGMQRGWKPGVQLRHIRHEVLHVAPGDRRCPVKLRLASQRPPDPQADSSRLVETRGRGSFPIDCC